MTRRRAARLDAAHEAGGRWPRMKTVQDTAESLQIRLLGELELWLGETPLPALESGRAESLLAYLLLNRDAPQQRGDWRFCCDPTRRKVRPAPTCGMSCTSSGGRCPDSTATSTPRPRLRLAELSDE